MFGQVTDGRTAGSTTPASKTSTMPTLTPAPVIPAACHWSARVLADRLAAGAAGLAASVPLGHDVDVDRRPDRLTPGTAASAVERRRRDLGLHERAGDLAGHLSAGGDDRALTRRASRGSTRTSTSTARRRRARTRGRPGVARASLQAGRRPWLARALATACRGGLAVAASSQPLGAPDRRSTGRVRLRRRGDGRDAGPPRRLRGGERPPRRHRAATASSDMPVRRAAPRPAPCPAAIRRAYRRQRSAPQRGRPSRLPGGAPRQVPSTPTSTATQVLVVAGPNTTPRTGATSA